MLRLSLLVMAVLLGGCGAGSGAGDGPPPAPEGPREGEQCFAPEVTRRGGEAPANPVTEGMPQPEIEVDGNGCAPARAVADNCCCGATEGPRFDGERCCYVFQPCGCC